MQSIILKSEFDVDVAPSSLPCAGPSFLIGQDHEGQWLAVETHGLGGGLFASRDAALTYARAETGRRIGAVLFAAEPIVLR